jgi:serine/threonine protein kinase
MNQALTSIVSNLSFQENECLNQFKVINKLGTPNKRKFNEVYLIKNVFLGEFAILKKLVKTNQNKHLWSVLKAESNFNFTHSNLPKTLHFIENEEEVILILNFQKGIPLNEFWKQLKSKNQLEFLKKLIAGLVPIFDELAIRKIVHGDIKPSNILVDDSENELKFSLIDFGMALDQNNLEERKTLFALGFSAPEIILNRLHLADQTSDIFALGISFWQLYAGKLPLTHPNPSVMTNLQITHPLPSHVNISKSLQQILNKMCYKHTFKMPPNLMKSEELDELLKDAKNQRFQTLQELQTELNQIPEKKLLGGIFSKFGR